MNKSKVKAAAFVLGLFVPIVPSGVYADVSLTSAARAALARSPALKGVQAQVDAIRGDFRETRSLRYPRLSVRSQVVRGDNPVYVFGSLLEQQTFGPRNFAIDSLNHPESLTNFKNALDLGVPLFAGFEISTGEKVRRLMIEQANDRYESAGQELRYRVAEAFLTVLQKQEKVRLLAERVDSASDEVEDAKRLNAKGLVLGSDFYAAQAVLSSLKARLLQAEKEQGAAKEVLAVLMGESPAALGRFEGRLSSPSYPPVDSADVVATAVASRKDLKGARLQVSASDLSFKQSKRSILPRIEAFASIETNSEDFESNPNNHTIGVRSSFPIGDPSYFARRSKAQSNIRWAQSQQESLEDQIRIDVIKAAKIYQAAVDGLSFVETAMDQSRKSLELFRPLYKEGRQSILDVLRAEDGLANTQLALNDNIFQIHLSYATLQWAMGQFTSSTLDVIEENLERAP